jgi:hypothetical protein
VIGLSVKVVTTWTWEGKVCRWNFREHLFIAASVQCPFEFFS